MRKPKLAVYKFASCDGCQLSLLDLEDELLEISDAVQIAFFMEATRAVVKGPYDICLVEGSISTPHDLELIKKIRRNCKILIAIGACATQGGIQALRNWADIDEFVKAVYASPEYIKTLEKSTPISDHVEVDYELRGCPINKYQLLELLSALLNGRKLYIPNYSVCVECKRRGNVCIMVSRGIPCLGPVTQAGCDAICPAYGRGCYACFGPSGYPNPRSLIDYFMENFKLSKHDAIHLLKGFTGWGPQFREVIDEYEREE